ncbi:hypothetical protein ABPG72_009473 [Tetrahymena utriculariae]
MSKLSTLHLIFVLVLILPNTQAGPIFIACEVACSTSCWGLNTLIPVPIAVYMACMVPCTALCVGSCFSEDTTFIVKNDDGTAITKRVAEIQSGDLIQTFDNDMNPIWTTVQSNVEQNGDFEFVMIFFRNNDALSQQIFKLETTSDHGIIVFNPSANQIHVVKARNIKQNYLLLGHHQNFMEIVKIQFVSKDKKYSLETEEGSALANQVFVSTICKEEINEDIPFTAQMSIWKQRHYSLKGHDALQTTK